MTMLRNLKYGPQYAQMKKTIECGSLHAGAEVECAVIEFTVCYELTQLELGFEASERLASDVVDGLSQFRVSDLDVGF